ncbi:MAG: FliH/SctL family protein [Myxococcaceae bacterium]
MSELRKPAFMQHTAPAPRSTGGNPKLASWSAASLDPALPLAPPVTAPPPPSPPPMGKAFEPLPPTPAPTPPPPVVIDHTPRLKSAIEALRQEGCRLGEQARSDALEIGVLIARRILERELTTSLDPLFGLIRSAIRKVGDARQIVVKVSVDDHRRLQDAPGSALSLANVTVQPDESLGPGDVVIESEQHGVDGRLDTRLDELRRELREAMNTE